MVHLSGIASAVYESECGAKLTVSAVEARNTEDIRLLHAETHDIDTRSIESLRERFCSLFALMMQMVQQRKTDGVSLPMPLVFGWPMKFPGPQFSATLRHAFHEVLCPAGASASAKARHEKQLRREASDKQRCMQWNRDDLHSAMREISELFASYLQCHGLSAFDITFRPRGFHVENMHEGDAEDRKRANTAERKFDADLPMFTALKARAEAGDVDALEELRGHARAYAGSYVQFLFDANLGLEDSRFIGLGFRKEPYISRYQWLDWFDLRQVFAQVVIERMHMQYNPAVILPSDAPMPQFSDPLATYLADQHDFLSGNRVKKAVMVRRDSPPSEVSLV